MTTITLKHAVVEYTPEGCITYFADGSSVGAHPHPEMPHYSVVAHRLGYGDDLYRYCVEHEVAHSLIGEHFLNGPSVVLWALAHGSEAARYAVVCEEVLAQTLQRWVRANEQPIVGGVDWFGLKARALEVLG